MVPRSILISSLLLLAIGAAWPARGSASFPPCLYTETKSYEPLAWMQGADRFPAGGTIFIREGSRRRPLVPEFAASADPAVSFDGERVLFAGKAHPRDPWQIWEVVLNGGTPRRITSQPEDSVRPLYLPEDRVVYARRVAGHFVIEAADLAGGKPLALTYGPANFLPTDVLHDGRILFEAGYPLGTGTTPEIYTVYPDGSGFESYRCDHGPARYAGRQSSSGDILFASAHGLSRYTSARARELSMAAPAGEYAGDVAEISSGAWLVSWRESASSTFKLMRWTSGAQALDPVASDAAAHLVQPTIIAAHAVPNRFPSALHDWPNANLLCLNAYTSKYQFAAGSIHTVRLYTRDADGKSKLLGSAPVESDGSFYVHVPSDQPLQIEMLDQAGKTLKREAGYFWMRRGEQRVCVGCHAGPETAPENAVPQILLKSTDPADMTGETSQSAAGGHE